MIFLHSYLLMTQFLNPHGTQWNSRCTRPSQKKMVPEFCSLSQKYNLMRILWLRLIKLSWIEFVNILVHLVAFLLHLLCLISQYFVWMSTSTCSVWGTLCLQAYARSKRPTSNSLSSLFCLQPKRRLSRRFTRSQGKEVPIQTSRRPWKSRSTSRQSRFTVREWPARPSISSTSMACPSQSWELSPWDSVRSLAG